MPDGTKIDYPMPDGVNESYTKQITISKGGSLKAEFGRIEYKYAGTYNYSIYELLPAGVDEKNPVKDGIKYDTTIHTAEVKVEDNNDGTLTATVKYDDDEEDLTITNTYSASGKTELKANKSINDWGKAESFTFTLESKDNAPMPEDAVDGKKSVEITKTTADLEAKFGEIKYTSAGTYYYTIKEEIPDGAINNKKDGITYDSAEHSVEVNVVDNHDGTLTATVKYDDEDDLTITNTYSASGKTELKAKKSINDWGKAESFTFTLESKDNAPMPEDAAGGKKSVVITKTTADLEAKFGEIKYTSAGTYYYTIKEEIPDGAVDNKKDGITYDSKEHNVEVNVVDNHDGTLTATVKYDDEEEDLTITNTYSASGKTELKAKKSINDWGKAESFTFTLESKDDAPMPEDAADGKKSVVITKTTADLEAKFGEIKYTSAGTYYYTIREEIPDGAVDNKKDGITYDSAEHSVEVEVVDNHDGTLTATVKYDDSEEDLTITNTYSASGKTELKAKKSINDWGKAESFTFTLERKDNAPMPEGAVDGKKSVEITKTTKDLEAKFGEIKYTSAGTYYYTIREEIPDGAVDNKKDGITYDSAEHSVEVEVVDNHDGTLTATVKYDDSEEDLTITNKYAANGKVDLSALKELTGRELKEGEFSFVLKDADGKVLQTKSNASDGTVTFDTINYTLPDVANSPFTYTLSEVIPDDADLKDGKYVKNGVTYDSTPQEITVTLEDKKDGTITANPDRNGASVKFTNKYDARGSIDLKGTKTLENRRFKDGDTWTFTVSSDDKTAPLPTNNPVTIKPTGGSSADIDYGKIEYKLSDLGGATTKVFNYTITETGSGSGVTNETRTHTMAVTVTDNGKGKLDISVVGENDGLSFTNTYDAKGKIELAGVKNITGRKFRAGDKWTFTIGSDDADAPMPDNDTVVIEPTSGTSESFSFGEINYKLSHAGKTFNYTVTESGTIAGVTNDPKVTRTVKVSVEDDGSGVLVVKMTEDSDSIVFTNAYDAKGDITLGGSKKITGREFRDGDTATFKIEAVGNAPLPKKTETTIRPTSGDSDTFTFGPIEYRLKDLGGAESKIFEYKVTESAAAMDGVTRDKSVISVKVTATDNGDGTLTVTADKEASDIVFTNKYSAKGEVVLAAKKKLNGRKLKAGEFSFELKDADGNLLQTKSNSADGTVTFDAIRYTLADVSRSPIKYTITEKIPSGAVREGGVYVKDGITYDGHEETITVKLADNKDGTITAKANRTGSSVKFTNTYDADGSIDLTGTKTIENRKFRKGDKWTFRIEAVTDGAPTPDQAKVTIKPTDGYTETIEYGTVDFTLSDLGGKTEKSFKYKVIESGTVDGVTNDSRTHTMTLTVRDNGDGTLSVTKDEDGGGLSFINTYKPRKTVKTGDDTNLIAPVVTFVVSLLLLIIAFFIFRRNRRNERAESDE